MQFLNPSGSHRTGGRDAGEEMKESGVLKVGGEFAISLSWKPLIGAHPVSWWLGLSNYGILGLTPAGV